MKIIILGAGQVGGTLAANLVQEDNDITVVDDDAQSLTELQTRLDIGIVCGPASHPTILQQAGIEDADMLIAVTSNDETNMVACQVAYTLFHTPTKIARIRSPHFLSEGELFDNKAIPIDVAISPEQLVTDHVHHLIQHPGTLQVLDFAGGRVQLVVIKPRRNGPLVGKTLSDIKEHLPDVSTHIAAIFRRHHSIPLTGKTTIEKDDEVFFITAAGHIEKVMQALGRKEEPYKRIIIAGGGNIGCRLAQSLEKDYNVKVIEHRAERAEYIVEQLHNTTVLLGDAADREMLIDEGIENTDVFCAVTNDDENNIMAALLAKRLGVRVVMALITRTAYVDLIEGGDIDIAISPQQATIGSILTHIRRGDIVNVHSLRRGAAEAIEVIAHGDKKTSKVVGRLLSQVKLPKGTTIGAVVRGDKIMIAKDDIVVEPDDHVILFLENKKHIHEVERLFQVSVTYI